MAEPLALHRVGRAIRGSQAPPRTLSHRGTGSVPGRGPPVGEVCHSSGPPQPSLPRGEKLLRTGPGAPTSC